jgi:hypothetical protein
MCCLFTVFHVNIAGYPAMLEQGTYIESERAFYFIVRKEMIDFISLLRSSKEAEEKAAIGSRRLTKAGIGRVLGMT